jgi:hypothetical protein
MVMMSYKIPANMELVNIEPLILGESQEGGSAVSMFLLVD